MTSYLMKWKTKLNEQIETNVTKQETELYIKNGIASDVSEGLAHTQKEKFASLTEGYR